MELTHIRQRMRELAMDGWLLYDFLGRNPIPARILELPAGMVSRRWFYWIPVTGAPCLIVHEIDRSHLVPPAGSRMLPYTNRHELAGRLREVLAPGSRIAMEYSPMGALPTTSLVDAGTIDSIRALQVEIIGSEELVMDLTCRWDNAQKAAHAAAAMGIHEAVQAAFTHIRTTRSIRAVTEFEVQQVMTTHMAAAGLIWDHPPIVAFGPHTGDPHYAPALNRPYILQEPMPVLIDVWARRPEPTGVYADITWMAHAGTMPDDRFMELFEIVLAARDRGMEFLAERSKAGLATRGWEVDQAVRDHIDSRGYGRAFIHRTGHHLGTEAAHGPGANLDNFETMDTRTLIPGLAFTIEPGIYLPEFGVRSEINVLLDDDGPRIITAVQKELIFL
ncbi:aminopeptidase P family protein [bacterium]|nr:aminopeptidase P family protein [candidate division CSSED10-310 bacterium]